MHSIFWKVCFITAILNPVLGSVILYTYSSEPPEVAFAWGVTDWSDVIGVCAIRFNRSFSLDASFEMRPVLDCCIVSALV